MINILKDSFDTLVSYRGKNTVYLYLCRELDRVQVTVDVLTTTTYKWSEMRSAIRLFNYWKKGN